MLNIRKNRWLYPGGSCLSSFFLGFASGLLLQHTKRITTQGWNSKTIAVLLTSSSQQQFEIHGEQTKCFTRCDPSFFAKGSMAFGICHYNCMSYIAPNFLHGNSVLCCAFRANANHVHNTPSVLPHFLKISFKTLFVLQMLYEMVETTCRDAVPVVIIHITS